MMETILLVGELILVCILVFLFHHVKKVADLINQRKLAYEGEKGKNLATKEDLAEITKQIETVKEEVSFASQRKKDYVVERKRHLINLLYYAEKISNGLNSLQIYARNSSDVDGLYTLIDRTNDTCLEMTHEFHILFAEYDGFEKAEEISNLVDNCSLLGAQIVTAAHNAAVAIKQAKNCMEESRRNPLQGEFYVRQSLELTAKASQMVSAPLPHKESAAEAINHYVIWLKDLFGKGLNFNYDIPNLQFEDIKSSSGTVIKAEPSA